MTGAKSGEWFEFFRWEGPRLPPGGKYSPSIPHSPAARDHRARLGTKGLFFEHVIPVAGVIRDLLRNLPADEGSLRQVLDATADRVLITREEDAALTAAGYRDTSPDPGTPWITYRALGLQRADFAPFPRPVTSNEVHTGTAAEGTGTSPLKAAYGTRAAHAVTGVS